MKRYDFSGGSEEWIEEWEKIPPTVLGCCVVVDINSNVRKPPTVSAMQLTEGSTINQSSNFDNEESVKINIDSRPILKELNEKDEIREFPSEVCQSFISSLLDINFLTRLGSGPYGSHNVKSHEFFRDIDWKLV